MMFKLPAALAVLGSTLVAASDVPTLFHRAMTHPAIMARQSIVSPEQIPAACQQTCQSTLNFYQQCTSGNTGAGCLGICSQSNFNGFVGCLQCFINVNPQATSSQVGSINQAISQLGSVCNIAGSSVSAGSVVASSVPVSGAGSATGSASTALQTSPTASASSAAASATSLPASISAPGSAALGSLTAGINSAASQSSAAATSSRSAGSAVAPFNFAHAAMAAALGLVGVAGGAVLTL